MKKLSDILKNGAVETLCQLWNQTKPASEFEALPADWYLAGIIAGELFNSRTNNTPGYKLTFRVLQGPHEGRLFWHECWLTPAALPQTLRDLLKLGVTGPSQLNQPLPAGIRCRVKLALQRDDNRNEFNKVRKFDVIGVDTPESDAFAPAASEANAEGGSDES